MFADVCRYLNSENWNRPKKPTYKSCLLTADCLSSISHIFPPHAVHAVANFPANTRRLTLDAAWHLAPVSTSTEVQYFSLCLRSHFFFLLQTTSTPTSFYTGLKHFQPIHEVINYWWSYLRRTEDTYLIEVISLILSPFPEATVTNCLQKCFRN